MTDPLENSFALDTTGRDESTLRGLLVDDRFRILSFLGEGGMGRVYKGIQLSINRPVAIKVLHNEHSKDAGSRRRFLDEAKILASMNHPNIVNLVDFGEGEEGLLYCIMEFVDGVSLSDVLSQPLTLQYALTLTKDIASALAQAHNAGIIHRDVKPENIFVTRMANGALLFKLLDFGVARSNLDGDATEEEGIIGTPFYLSPEQAYGREPLPQSDLYSLGCLLYRVLAGHLPFDFQSPMQALVAHAELEPIPLESYRPDLPADALALVRSMLAKAPVDRPGSATDVVQTVERLAQAQDIQLRVKGAPGMIAPFVHKTATGPPDTAPPSIPDAPQMPASRGPAREQQQVTAGARPTVVSTSPTVTSGKKTYLPVVGLVTLLLGVGIAIGAASLGETEPAAPAPSATPRPAVQVQAPQNVDDKQKWQPPSGAKIGDLQTRVVVAVSKTEWDIDFKGIVSNPESKTIQYVLRHRNQSLGLSISFGTADSLQAAKAAVAQADRVIAFEDGIAVLTKIRASKIPDSVVATVRSTLNVEVGDTGASGKDSDTKTGGPRPDRASSSAPRAQVGSPKSPDSKAKPDPTKANREPIKTELAPSTAGDENSNDERKWGRRDKNSDDPAPSEPQDRTPNVDDNLKRELDWLEGN